MRTDPTPRRPVELTGTLDGSPSRWLWLVKWFLALPHLLVLALLWPVFVVLTAVAGVAILFTGRYPPSLFDVNVGVLRWTWRVTFYAFVLGTDRYPPFTLAEVPDYPATLRIERPEELSRGLVLVKWWLLALPHYLIIGVFGGGSAGGLIGLLALIAGVALLFTGRYPTTVFDFVMGMERWTYRVLAYAALQRDEYPPFRLDLGGAEPTSLGAPGSGPSPTPTGRVVEA